MKRKPLSSIYTLRDSQKQILQYRQGWMGISAVPGSGKTWTLSLLAADLITRGGLREGQEVLVVTLVNSAVDNFTQRVNEFLNAQKILPMGFRVRTLHGLAHDIVRERPGLVGLPNNFSIIDEREAGLILGESARTWVRSHPFELDDWFSETVDDNQREWLRRDKLVELVQEMGLQFIRTAKDLQLTPENISHRLSELPMPLPLAEIGAELYSDYQRALVYRGAVDFDDLIQKALLALNSDSQFLERLQQRWPFILEDEAQDSSRLQEDILRLLNQNGGNWVRVGDPNQAIYETFTTAHPRYLKNFLNEPGVRSLNLPTSGRSTESIIHLANYLVEWTQNDHPVEEAQDALYGPPFISLTESDDPQPNPGDRPEQVHLVTQRFTPQEEIEAVVKSIKRWLPDHPLETVAVLAPRNQRGFDCSNELKKAGIEFIELLQSTSRTRLTTSILIQVFQCLAEPQSITKLANVYRVWHRAEYKDAESLRMVEKAVAEIKRIQRVEDYLWPGEERDWLEYYRSKNEDPTLADSLEIFRNYMRRWQAAIDLPVDQLLITISQDLFKDASDLALSYKLATLLRHAKKDHQEWRLPQLTEELVMISKNERKFLGFSQDDLGFNPENYKGKVVISTIHKAKGLEWDRVYLLSVNSYDFPTDIDHSRFISEKWYIRDQINMSAETLAQLKALFSSEEWDWYKEGVATRQSRLDYIKERLRLFYVGITRARKELVITWNTGRQGDQQPAVPLIALSSHWESEPHMEEENNATTR